MVGDADDEALALLSRLRGRFQGALLGLALGEALAAPAVLGRPGMFPPVRDLIGGGPHDLPRGAWGDDTALALCVAQSLIEQGACDPDDQLARYRRWQRDGENSATGECIGIGAGTARALVAGRPDAAVADDAASLSCVVPLALRYWADEVRLQAAVRDAIAVTCHDPATFDAATRFASMLSAALRGAPIAEVALRSGDGSDGVGRGAPMQALAAAARASTEGSGWKDIVLRAINRGGPADTVGAFAGAIAGATLGIEAVPAAWVAALARREDIAGLADRLLAEALVGLADPA